jgi:tetraacyldisaccharide 4'-kinase
LVVVDGERRLGNGRLLPAGPLREAATRLNDVDAVIMNGGSEPQGDSATLRMRLAGTVAVALRGSQLQPLVDFAGQAVHAVAAIGNPQRFFSMLRSYGIDVLEHPLPDHAALRSEDISFGDGRAVLMTEKDAVKCLQIAGNEHWYVPVSATFDVADSDRLLGIVMNAIGRRAEHV